MDTSNLDLKGLWASQKIQSPDLAELHTKLDQYKKATRNHTLRASLALSVTGSFILFVWYYFQPELVTTKLGIVTIIGAIALYIFAINRLSSSFKTIDNSMSNQEYLDQLLVIKNKQRWLQTTVLNFYFLLLSTGLALYLFEYTWRMKFVWGVVTYSVTGAWVLVNWFYFRPKVIRKERAKLDQLIERVEKLKEQF